jgi:alpha-D-ribose 1-methylphosphonate 5-triphosphate synthase subunit PhnI
MNTNNFGDLAFVKTEIDRRYGLRDRHGERPTSSLAILARSMRRRRWEETHPRGNR